VNAGFLTMVVIVRLLQKVFFGPLRPLEVEVSWPARCFVY